MKCLWSTDMSVIKPALKAILSEQTISKLRQIKQAATVNVISKLRRVKQAATIDVTTAARHDWVLRYSEEIQGGQRSIVQGKPCDRNGRPIPWMTYSSIEYLSQLDLSQCRIFEYGSGNSSKYWASRCQKIVSVEHDPVWFEFGSHDLATNQSLLFCTEPAAYVNAISYDEYDLIVIDGLYRVDCAKRAVENLSKHGLIILDNSDWYPATCHLLAEKGLLQVDFAGPGPNRSYASCTSLFFTRGFSLPRQSNSISVLGGFVHVSRYDCPIILAGSTAAGDEDQTTRSRSSMGSPR
jgi:hypothetical protein